jgi:hypothetical protein
MKFFFRFVSCCNYRVKYLALFTRCSVNSLYTGQKLLSNAGIINDNAGSQEALQRSCGVITQQKELYAIVAA